MAENAKHAKITKFIFQFFVSFVIFACLAFPPHPQAQGPSIRILVFSKTAAFRHDSIPDGINAITQLGQQYGFQVDATEDASVFNDADLIPYRAIVFLSTTGDILNSEQQAAFERYMRNGGGFAGIHSASDTEYDWPWYGGLVGAYFLNHPPGTTRASIKIEDASHPSTSAMPTVWERTDEWYNFRINPRGRVKVLSTLDENTYLGGSMGSDHPIAWCQLYENGRTWYTAGGHTKESYAEPLFRQHLLGGIQFAARIKDGACSALTAASAASYKSETIASDSIASIFGVDLSNSTGSASTTPLPTNLSGTSVRIKDSMGQERLAPLFFVSPSQINFQVPSDIATGEGLFTVIRSDATAPGGRFQLVTIAPGLFSANANGNGIAAGVALRDRNGSQQFEPISRYDQALNKHVAVPIDLGPATDNVYLVLFGTGIRFNPGLSSVSAVVGGIPSQVSYAGRQGTLVGLDQVNVLLPRGLAGRGEVDVSLMVGNQAVNTVNIDIK